MTQPQSPNLRPQQPPSLPPSGSGEPVVNPTPESRLDQLAARYDLLKLQADDMTKQLEEVKDAIKAELAPQIPGDKTSVLLTSPHLRVPLRMKFISGGWVIDSKAIKAAVPENVWKPWAKQKQGHWELKAAG